MSAEARLELVADDPSPARVASSLLGRRRPGSKGAWLNPRRLQAMAAGCRVAVQVLRWPPSEEGREVRPPGGGRRDFPVNS
jgi:hypothetical protein